MSVNAMKISDIYSRYLFHLQQPVYWWAGITAYHDMKAHFGCIEGAKFNRWDHFYTC